MSACGKTMPTFTSGMLIPPGPILPGRRSITPWDTTDDARVCSRPTGRFADHGRAQSCGARRQPGRGRCSPRLPRHAVRSRDQERSGTRRVDAARLRVPRRRVGPGPARGRVHRGRGARPRAHRRRRGEGRRALRPSRRFQPDVRGGGAEAGVTRFGRDSSQRREGDGHGTVERNQVCRGIHRDLLARPRRLRKRRDRRQVDHPARHRSRAGARASRPAVPIRSPATATRRIPRAATRSWPA